MSNIINFDKITKMGISCKKRLVEVLSENMTEKDIAYFNSADDEKLTKSSNLITGALNLFIDAFKTKEKALIQSSVDNFNKIVRKASGKTTAELKPPATKVTITMTPPPPVPPPTTTTPLLTPSPPPVKEEISDEELLAAADLMTGDIPGSDFTGEEPVELPNILDFMFKVEDGDDMELDPEKKLLCLACETLNNNKANFCRNCGEEFEKKNKTTVVLDDKQKNVLATFCPNDNCNKFKNVYKPTQNTKFCARCRTKLLRLVVETMDDTPVPTSKLQKIFSFFFGKKK
jgi:hypothetical protein